MSGLCKVTRPCEPRLRIGIVLMEVEKMKRALLKLCALGCMLLAVPMVAMADENSESDVYTGSNYTIVPPAKWILVSGNLGDKELSKLPENVREHYNQRNTDVLFMNIEGLDKPTQGFKDSLNLVTVNESIPLTDALVAELKEVLKQQYGSMFEKFDLKSMEKSKLGDREVFEVQGEYAILNYKVKMRQVFIPLESTSLVVTCTYEESREAEVTPLCAKSLESLTFK